MMSCPHGERVREVK
nr:TPA_asm: m117.1 uORF RNA *1 [Murid betaherpesvirus 1]DBA07894.1 TPA_asm: m117.1 uORF RNA *1 [Murid betaherpesvirus 1]